MIYLFDNICVFLIYSTVQKYDFFLCFSLLVFYDCIYLNNNTVKMFYCEVLYQYTIEYIFKCNSWWQAEFSAALLLSSVSL